MTLALNPQILWSSLLQKLDIALTWCILQSIVTSYPQPNAVVHWTHAATCEWLRKIDLAEFTPNLLCAGTPGALMVSFLASTVAYVIRFEGPVSGVRADVHCRDVGGNPADATSQNTSAKASDDALQPALGPEDCRREKRHLGDGQHSSACAWNEDTGE